MYETITEILAFVTFILIILSGIIYVIENIKDIFRKKEQLEVGE